MAFTLAFFLINLFCSWFQCELGANPPYITTTGKNTKELIQFLRGGDATSLNFDSVGGPVVVTKNGMIEGYKMNISKEREIFAFTGVPYGESPTGPLRFRDPVPRKPWKNIWKATSPSPFCIQLNAVTMGMLRGQEDCLYLDIYTPSLPEKSGTSDLPVIVWIPAGANIYGRSVSYGPAYFLREDVVLVVLNVRFGIFGFLTTGDEASPGNWGLKDQTLAVKWIYENIEAFRGNKNKIVIGGASSGAYAAQLMLYTSHETRNYISGIFGISGSPFSNHGLDATGRVKNSSDMIAAAAGCPTAAEGKSWEMVECLRKMNPYILAARQYVPYSIMPPMSNMLGPSVEPDLAGAFISRVPEEMYERGEVPPIPLIVTRSEDEASFILQRLRFVQLPVIGLKWYDWMPKFLHNIGFRSFKGEPAQSYEESEMSLLKINRLYFNKATPPNFIKKKDFIGFVNLVSDTLYNAGTWKSVELHHKVGPTYMYLTKHKTFSLIPIIDLTQKVFTTDFGSSHATDLIFFFNNSKTIPPLKPGSDFDIASRNIVNMIVNFANYGEPKYRTPEGILTSPWKPITDMKEPLVLEVGLVHNIKMISDPLAGSERMKVWNNVRFQP